MASKKRTIAIDAIEAATESVLEGIAALLAEEPPHFGGIRYVGVWAISELR